MFIYIYAYKDIYALPPVQGPQCAPCCKELAEQNR